MLAGENAAYHMQPSANVAADGNFSIQVLSKALQQFGEITTTPFGSTENTQADMTNEHGFICHKGNHWIAIRKVNNVWYNLNSTNITPPGPQFISDFLLSAFLGQIRNSGFSIFIVRAKPGNQLPGP